MISQNCFFCEENSNLDCLYYLEIGEQTFYKCIYCQPDFFSNVISFKDNQNNIKTVSFYSKNNGELKKYSSCEELSNDIKINKQKFNFLGFLVSTNENENLNEIVFTNNLTELKNKIKIDLKEVCTYSIVLEKNYFKNTVIGSLVKSILNKKKMLKNFQSVLTENISWSPQNHQFYSKKENSIVLSLLLSFKSIAFNYFSLKIPKYLVYSIIENV